MTGVSHNLLKLQGVKVPYILKFDVMNFQNQSIFKLQG